jgi:predicted RNA-binding Zn-ribbon protein involved in translation (DUF1610 family)
MFIPKAVCETCGVPMHVQKNGVLVEMTASGAGYYKIYADRYACPRCGGEILTGFAKEPVYEAHQEDYGREESDVLIELNS